MTITARKKWWYYSLAIICPALVMSLIFFILQLAPFGSKGLFISDIGTQYLAFFTKFRQSILTHDFSFYSFSLSLGDNAFPLLAYYLLSPFNLLILLFPAEQVPVAINLIILLKICGISLTTAIYFRVTYHHFDPSAIMFACAFSMCGFVTMYFYDLMWLDALIILPLLVLGLRRLYFKKKFLLYVVTLWLTIITNYYLGYMACIFAIIYFFYLIVREKDVSLSIWQACRQKWPLILNFFISSFFTGLMAAVVLVPTMLGMLKTSKRDLALASFLPTFQFGFDVFAQLGVIGSNYYQHLTHDPSVFVGTLTLLMVIIYMLIPPNSSLLKQQKHAAIGLLLVLFAGLLITSFNTIWHMMQQPNGFPFRNVYFLSFIMILIGYDVWQRRQLIKPIMLQKSCAIAISLLFYGYLMAGALKRITTNADLQIGLSINWFHLLLGITFILVTSVILHQLLFGQHYQISAILSLFILVLIELGVNFGGSFADAPLGSQDLYAQNYRYEQNWISTIKQKNPEFFRVNNENSLINNAFIETYNNYNDPLLFGIRGINLYSSTLNNATRQMLTNLGFFSKNDRRVSSEGATLVSSALFGIKYRLNMTTDNSQLIVSQNNLGLGFAVSNKILKMQLAENDALTNQQVLLNRIANNSLVYFTTPIEKQFSIISGKKNQVYNWQLEAHTNGPFYAYLPDTDFSTASFWIDGKRIKNRINVSKSAIFNLGNVQKNQKIKVQLVVPSNQPRPTVDFKVLNQDIFYNTVDTLTKGKLKLQARWKSNNLTGTITVLQNQQVLLLSLPYDPGWQIIADGKVVKTHRVLGNLTAFPLPKGRHTIKMSYTPPGLKIGIVISLIGLVGLILWTIIYGKINKSKN